MYRIILSMKFQNLSIISGNIQKFTGVKNVSLTNLDTIAQVGAEEGYIAPEDVSRLLKFRDNPSDESWINGGKN